jgi:hypothetical protein
LTSATKETPEKIQNMDTKQCTAEILMGDQSKKRRNQKVSRYNENKNTTYQNL